MEAGSFFLFSQPGAMKQATQDRGSESGEGRGDNDRMNSRTG